MTNVLVMHGPNLNLLGQREPEIYGNTTLEALNKQLTEKATDYGLSLECFQSNHEGDLITHLQKQLGNIDSLIINPAGFTHTSVALRDAVLAIGVPCIEVHLSNIYRREPFRQHSFFSDISEAVCSGFGAQSYFYALDFVHQQLTNK